MAKPTMTLADVERVLAEQDAQLRAAHRALVARLGVGASVAVPQAPLDRIAEATRVAPIVDPLRAIRC